MHKHENENVKIGGIQLQKKNVIPQQIVAAAMKKSSYNYCKIKLENVIIVKNNNNGFLNCSNGCKIEKYQRIIFTKIT